jgi:hypothetical protein
MFPKLSAQELAKADKEGKPISYSAAIKRLAKEGNFITITPVKWDAKTPKQYKEVTLKSIGKVRIIITPKLPRGYEMMSHTSEDNLLLSIFDGRKTYTPDQMDSILADLEYLRKNELVHSWVFDWLSISVDGEDIPFIGDYENHNWINYDKHKADLSAKWRNTLSKCNFFVVHNLTGLGSEMLSELNTLYDWNFEAPGCPKLFDCDSIANFDLDNPFKREPTEQDEQKIRLAFNKILAARKVSLNAAINLLNSEVSLG